MPATPTPVPAPPRRRTETATPVDLEKKIARLQEIRIADALTRQTERAERPERLDRQCATATGKRKMRYGSRTEAARSAKRNRISDEVVPYSCGSCGYWHIGHPNSFFEQSARDAELAEELTIDARANADADLTRSGHETDVPAQHAAAIREFLLSLGQ